MADVAHSPIGFTGTVDQVGEAKRFSMASARFRTASATDWSVTAVTTSDRTVQIATGAAEVCGVYDATAAAATIQLAANGGATTRYDAIVATFDWAATPPAVSFRAVAGTTAVPAVNTAGAVDAAKINRVPGSRYDALLAVVSVAAGQGALAAVDVTDCRVWGGFTAPLHTAKSAYVSLIDGSVGYELIADDTGIGYYHDGSGWQAGGSAGGSRIVAYGAMTSSQVLTSSMARVLGGLNVPPTLVPGRFYECELGGAAAFGSATVEVRTIAGSTAPGAATGTAVAASRGQDEAIPVATGKFTVGTAGTYTVSPFVMGSGSFDPNRGGIPITITIRDTGPSAGIVGSTPIAVP